MIVPIQSRCSGCRLCELICSIRNAGVNNPKKSRIRIKAEFPQPSFKVIVCNGCGKCAELCPEKAIIRTARGTYKLDEKKCTNCRQCVSACPSNAIFVHEELNTPIFCIFCGQCTKICPFDALQIRKNVDR